MNISIKNVSLTYPTGKKALSNISIELNNPTMIGLLGPNGAGKSTLMKLLVAELLPSSGEILLDGLPLLKKEKELKSKLGYLPQSFGLYEELTVWQFLDYMCALKNIKENRVEIAKVISQTNLKSEEKHKIKTLSGGLHQRVGIAQALLSNPEILILDEPTVGLDPEERINFRNLFSEIAQDKIVLLSTHIIEDIQSVCNALIVINYGEILFCGAPTDLVSLAKGHVGIMEDEKYQKTQNLHISSRLNTANGIVIRVVGNVLPSFVTIVEPTLEDAYLYLITCGEAL